ncbi:MAG: zinc-binding dehydrogenase [Nitrososphaeria archaeon]
MAKTGKAAIAVGYGKPLEVREFELPEVDDNSMLLKNNLCGICGTDIHIWEGRIPFKAPAIIGHEVVSKIQVLGKNIKTDNTGTPVKVGDRVMVNVGVACKRCYLCLLDEYTECLNKTGPQPPGVQTIEQKPHFVGGYAEYFFVRSGMEFVRIPDELTDEEVASFSCAGPTIIHGFERITLRAGDSVVVQGVGPVGLFAIIYAKAMGAGKVVAIGAPERRLEMAKKLGADSTINIEKYGTNERIAKVKELTNNIGPDLICDASGIPAAVPEGMEMLRNSGTYLIVGQFSDRGTIPIKPHYITLRQLKLQGTMGYTAREIYRYLMFLKMTRTQIPYKDVISHKFKLEQATEALETVKKGEAVRAVFVP